MLSHTWAFSRMNLPSHVWIDSFTYVCSRMNLFISKSTFSRMDWLSHLCFLTHEPFYVWIYLLTYGLTLSPMLSHAWAFSRMNLLSHVWIGSLTCAFSRMSHLWIYLLTYGLIIIASFSHAWAFLPMSLLSHVCNESLTYNLSNMSIFTSESTFSRMDWLSHLCFLAHEPFHL